MCSRTLTHLIRPRRLTAVTPTTTEEVNIKAPSTPDTKMAAPISKEVTGATMKDIHTKMDALRALREAGATITMPIRRSINPVRCP